MLTSFHLSFGPPGPPGSPGSPRSPAVRGAAVGDGVGAAAQGGRAACAAVHPQGAALGQRGWRPETWGPGPGPSGGMRSWTAPHI